MFYRVNQPVSVVEETKKNINLEKNKFDFQKFDKEVEIKCRQNMFYNYK